MHHLLLFFLQLLNHRLALLGKFVTFEHSLGFTLKVLNQSVRVQFEHLAPAPANLQYLRAIGITKVVNVAPVFGKGSIRLRGDPFGEFFQKRFNDAGLASSGKPGDKDIEAGLVHSQAKLNRANRSLLANEIF